MAATAIPFIQPFQDDVEEDSGVSTEGEEGGRERGREWKGGGGRGERRSINSALHSYKYQLKEMCR